MRCEHGVMPSYCAICLLAECETMRAKLAEVEALTMDQALARSATAEEQVRVLSEQMDTALMFLTSKHETACDRNPCVCQAPDVARRIRAALAKVTS